MNSAIDADDICPKRFGLNYDPPSITLEYLQVSAGRLFHRRIGLKRLRPSTDPTRVAEKMRQRNAVLLSESHISLEQLVALVKRLQDHMVGSKGEHLGGAAVGSIGGAQRAAAGPRASAERARSEATASAESKAPEPLRADAEGASAEPKQLEVDYHTVDLNKLPKEELDEHKRIMDAKFYANRKKPGDPDFVYDVQVDFAVDPEAPCGWDSDSD